MATPSLWLPPPTLLATATPAMASVPLMPRLRLMAPTDTLALLDSATAMVVPTPLALGPTPPPSTALPALLTLVPTPLATAMASVPLMPRLRLMAPTDTLALLDWATAMVVPTP